MANDLLFFMVKNVGQGLLGLSGVRETIPVAESAEVRRKGDIN